MHTAAAIDDACIYARALSAEEVAVLAGGNSAYDGLNRRIAHAERDFCYLKLTDSDCLDGYKHTRKAAVSDDKSRACNTLSNEQPHD